MLNIPNRLKKLKLNIKDYHINKSIRFHKLIDYEWTNKDEFCDAYFLYLKDIYGYDSYEETLEYYAGLFYEFIDIMKSELQPLNLSEDELWELYVQKTIWNFYGGLLCEKYLNKILNYFNRPQRTDKEFETLDFTYKIDSEYVDSYDNLIGIQVKSISYLSKQSLHKEHIKAMQNYENKYNASAYYLIHNANNKPLCLKSDGSYLIPCEYISQYKQSDFIVGSWEDLNDYL